MSIWTTVTGVVRLSYCQDNESDEDVIAKVRNLLGRTVDYDGPQNEWDTCDVPRGSEGSIHFIVSLINQPNCNDRVLVSVYGNLRDFEAERLDEIDRWYYRTMDRMKAEKFYVSDLWVTAKTERHQSLYTNEGDQLRIVKTFHPSGK